MTTTQRLVLWIAIIASVVGALDGFIVNVALPTISKDVGGGLVTQQWVVDAYLITLGALILIAGSLSDLFGRRRILTIGLIGFGVTSVLCAVAPNSVFLIFARALQGIAGALLVPSSLAMIISAFSGPAQGKAIGTWTSWFSVAAIAGPLLGGIIVSTTSWRWIFAINVLPIGVTLWLLTKLHLGEKTVAKVRVDLAGAILCTLGLAAAVYALIEQSHFGWGDPRIYGLFSGGLVLLAAYIWYEGRAKQPMLPLSLFTVRNFWVGNIATAAIYAGLSVSSFLIAIFLQQVGGYSALAAGLAMLPVTVVMFALSQRFGALAGKFGPRLFMSAGPLLAAIGFVLMLRIQAHVGYVTQLLPGVLLFALGLATTVAPLTSAILGNIEPRNAGVASAVNNAVSRIAGLVAIAVIGAVTGPHLDVAGFRRALLVTAGLLAAGGVISAIGIQNSRKIVKLETGKET